MPPKNKADKSKITKYEMISSVLLVVSIGVNIFFAVLNNNLEKEKSEVGLKLDKEKNARDKTEFALRLKENSGFLIQERLIFPGTSLRAFVGKDWSSNAIVDGGAHPEFIQTSLSSSVFQFINATTSVRKLRSVEAEFITFKNSSTKEVDKLVIRSENQKDSLVLEHIAPGTIKFLMCSYVQQQPWSETKHSFEPKYFSYTYSLLDSVVVVTKEIPGRTETSWIPTINTFYGVGKALISSENDHLFKQLD